MPRNTSSYARLSCLALLLAPLSVMAAEGDPIVFTPPADAPAGGNGFVGVLEVTSNGTINNQDDARVSLNSGTGTRATYTESTIDFGPNNGHFFVDNNFAHPGDNISQVIQGTVNIPTAGQYTFGVNSDDGFTLAFPTHAFDSNNGGNGANLQTYNGLASGALQFYGGRGNNDSFGQITLPAGPVPFQLTFHQGNGGYGVELFSAQGFQTAFSTNFKLLNTPASTVPKRLVGAGTWDYYELPHNTTSSLSDAITAYNDGAPPAFDNHSSPKTINFVISNQGGGANHGDSVLFPADNPNFNNNFGAGARVPFSVAAADAGKFTFDVLSDDSFRFRVLNSDGTPATNLLAHAQGSNSTGLADGSGFSDDPSCCGDGLGTFNLAAGSYFLEAIFNQQLGGASFEVYGAQGDYSSYDPNLFQLVGQNLNQTVNIPAGLQLVPEPASLSLLSLGAIGLLARRRRRHA